MPSSGTQSHTSECTQGLGGGDTCMSGCLPQPLTQDARLHLPIFFGDFALTCLLSLFSYSFAT